MNAPIIMNPMGIGILPAEVEQAAQLPENDFGKYILIKLLGKGGMGEVYKAWEKTLGRFVAVKMLKVTDEEDIARFQREAQIAARLNNPNIAAIYEIARERERWYISMQFIDGQMLEEVHNLRQTLKAVMQVCYATHYAHTMGVIHRDINPRNIMIDKTGKGYVTDFGVARQKKSGDTVTETGVIVGTPNYMSPEQARGQKLDPRTDIYSLGATLYYAVSESAPFLGDDPLQIVLKVINDEPPSPRALNPKIDRDLEIIILKCMEKDPDRRYRTAKELADDLKAYLNDEPITARDAGVVYKAIKKAKKYRVRLTIGVLLSLILALGMVVVRPPPPTNPGPTPETPAQKAAALTLKLRDIANEAKPFMTNEQIDELEKDLNAATRAVFALIPHYADAHVERARFFWKIGRPADASEELKAAVRSDPSNARAFLHSTWFKTHDYMLKRHTVALNNLTLWKKGVTPKFLEPVDDDGMKALAADARTDAREYLRLIGNQDPPTVRLAQGLVAVLTGPREYPEAERCLEDAKKSRDWRMEATLLQGFVRYLRDDYKGAEQSLSRARSELRLFIEMRIMIAVYLYRWVVEVVSQQRDPYEYEEALINDLMEVLKVSPDIREWGNFAPVTYELMLELGIAGKYIKQARVRLEGS